LFNSFCTKASGHYVIKSDDDICKLIDENGKTLDFHLSHRRNTKAAKLKRLINPMRGFQPMKTAYATIKGFEVMRMFKKGQFNI